MAFDLKQMERDLLETVRDIGDVGFRGGAHSPASKILIEKYIDQNDPWHTNQQLTALIDYLVEKRFLYPVYNSEGKVSSGYARGITPKGLRRLRKLQAPRWTWVKVNWFPVLVAGITAVIGLGAIATELYLNWE